MLGETEKSSDVCRTASLSEMGHERRAAKSQRVWISVDWFLRNPANKQTERQTN